jgi:heat shock protein HspQ
MKQAKFSIGQCIHHRLFDYRGVVVDVDPEFQGSDDWYENVAKSQPPKDEPWYHVLVHDADNETYVAERNLTVDNSNEPVSHPLLQEFFVDFEQGVYLTGRQIN